MTHDGYSMTHYKLVSFRVAGLIDHPPGDKANNKGFSLVELLTVMTILAVLAAMIIPSYNNYINKTRNARAESEIRTLSTEISGYALDHNGVNPPDLAAINRSGYLDPWKGLYVYNNFAIIGNPPPLMDPLGVYALNSDYDLYSKGSDRTSDAAGGNPANNDDIARLNDGAFIGVR